MNTENAKPRKAMTPQTHLGLMATSLSFSLVNTAKLSNDELSRVSAGLSLRPAELVGMLNAFNIAHQIIFDAIYGAPAHPYRSQGPGVVSGGP